MGKIWPPHPLSPLFFFAKILKTQTKGGERAPRYIWNYKFMKPYDLRFMLSGLRWFLTIESPLKMMKNTFYFPLKALFVLKVFAFLF